MSPPGRSSATSAAHTSESDADDETDAEDESDVDDETDKDDHRPVKGLGQAKVRT